MTEISGRWEKVNEKWENEAKKFGRWEIGNPYKPPP